MSRMAEHEAEREERDMLSRDPDYLAWLLILEQLAAAERARRVQPFNPRTDSF